MVAVGEIGFDAINSTEEEFFVRQSELAREHNLPILIHSPHLGKLEGITRLIEILKGMDYPMDKVLMDHNVEDTTPISLKAGCWAGHTVYPISKLSPERMANILEDNGYSKMMINSAADWGPSDPLMTTHVLAELRARGASEKNLEKLVWDNPWNFFSKSGRLK